MRELAHDGMIISVIWTAPIMAIIKVRRVLKGILRTKQDNQSNELLPLEDSAAIEPAVP